jgi:hypothetical protein
LQYLIQLSEQPLTQLIAFLLCLLGGRLGLLRLQRELLLLLECLLASRVCLLLLQAGLFGSGLCFSASAVCLRLGLLGRFTFRFSLLTSLSFVLSA